MAGKPAEPPHPGHQPVGEARLASGASSGRHADERGREHTGPAAVERHVKDDGRALILYWDVRRSEDPPQPA